MGARELQSLARGHRLSWRNPEELLSETLSPKARALRRPAASSGQPGLTHFPPERALGIFPRQILLVSLLRVLGPVTPDPGAGTAPHPGRWARAPRGTMHILTPRSFRSHPNPSACGAWCQAIARGKTEFEVTSQAAGVCPILQCPQAPAAHHLVVLSGTRVAEGIPPGAPQSSSLPHV